MQFVKNIAFIFITTCVSLALFGCATCNHGLYENRSCTDRCGKYHSTKLGASIGACSGAIAGAVIGGTLGMGLGALGGVSGYMLLVPVIGGATVGALIVGGVGGLLGCGCGYAVDTFRPCKTQCAYG